MSDTQEVRPDQIPAGLSLVEVWRREADLIERDASKNRARREAGAAAIRACADELERYSTVRLEVSAEPPSTIRLTLTAPHFDEERATKLILGRLTALHGWTEEADARGLIPDEDAKGQKKETGCYDCGLPYRLFHGDMALPDEEWERINPAENPGGGLLCANCIMRRLAQIADDLPLDLVAYLYPVPPDAEP